MDLSLIQTLLALIEDKASKVSIMQLLTSSYGGIDIKKIYFSTSDVKYVRQLEATMELLVVILVD